MQGKDLTQKQQRAIARAPAKQRAGLIQSFKAQPKRNANRNGGGRAAVPRMLPAPTRPKTSRGRGASGSTGASMKDYVSIWSPLHPEPIPTTVSDGHAHCTTGMMRKSFTLNGSERAIMFCTSTGDSGTVGLLMKWNNSGSFPTSVSWTNFVMPTLSGNAALGNGPTAGRAMKAAITITNTSPERKVSGTVLTLDATQRIVWSFQNQSNIDVARANNVFEQLANQNQSRMTTGNAYREPKEMRCHPLNDVEYSMFRPFKTSTDIDEMDGPTTHQAKIIDHFLGTISTSSPSNAFDTEKPHPNYHEQPARPMSTVCVLFESPVEPQNYTITARGSYYTRWPMEHVMGQHHPPIKTAPAGVVAKLRDAAEAFSGVSHDVHDGFLSLGQGLGKMFNTGQAAYSMYTNMNRMRGALPLLALGG